MYWELIKVMLESNKPGMYQAELPKERFFKSDFSDRFVQEMQMWKVLTWHTG
jgi:hypothetical protein